jgi:hypothetical protein
VGGPSGQGAMWLRALAGTCLHVLPHACCCRCKRG